MKKSPVWISAMTAVLALFQCFCEKSYPLIDGGGCVRGEGRSCECPEYPGQKGRQRCEFGGVFSACDCCSSECLAPGDACTGGRCLAVDGSCPICAAECAAVGDACDLGGCYFTPEGYYCLEPGTKTPGEECLSPAECVVGVQCFDLDGSPRCAVVCLEDYDCAETEICADTGFGFNVCAEAETQ